MPDKRMSTHFDIVRRADSRKNKPKSAVEAASYISRSVLEIERTGEKTYPKYHEDLVHSEILLPKQAPREYADRQTLWNAVEKNEKHCRAQLARSFRAGLPNEWTYEQATEIVRDFVQKNFVDKGMCADFAIHDSVNDKGQRNLHFHLLLTMTPILENGEWGKRQEKPHKLDKNGEWARDKKGRYIYDKPIQLTDWNSREKAKEWRKALADTINANNERLGIGVHWEHRSNKELGIDTIPEIHLGQCASALERKGIQTERGNINREIREMNKQIIMARENYLSAKKAFEDILAKPVQAVRKIKTEIEEMLEKVSARWARLELPVNTSKYLKYVSGRDRLQEIENAMRWLEKNGISTYAELHSFIKKSEQSYGQNNFLRNDNAGALKRLKNLVALYNEYQPYKEYHDKSISLSGFAKRSYDKQHATELEAYATKRKKLLEHLDGEKITPKAWREEIAEIEKILPELNERWGNDVINLSMGEVIEHNREKVDRAERVDREQRNVSQNTQEQTEQKKKRREESL